MLYLNQKDNCMKEFVNRIVTLDNIKQWEERDSVIKETVSQHSFKVSAICIYILEDIAKKNGLKSDYRWIDFALKCVEYSVLHDFDEAILGRDISHVVKYNHHNGEKIREQLNDFVEYQTKELGLEFVNESIDGDVKSFVKMCDWFAMLTFIGRNQTMGVLSFDKEREYCLQKAGQSMDVVKFMLKHKFSDYQLDLTIFNNLTIYG